MRGGMRRIAAEGGAEEVPPHRDRPAGGACMLVSGTCLAGLIVARAAVPIGRWTVVSAPIAGAWAIVDPPSSRAL